MNGSACSKGASARELSVRMVEKVWGRDSLPAPFSAPDGKRIGEIWFEPPPEFDSILVKYLFTSEKLSVQVHPSNETARAGEAGKTECWLVLEAEPGARLGIGFDVEISQEAMARVASDGTIEDLISWREVEAKDVFFAGRRCACDRAWSCACRGAAEQRYDFQAL